MKTINVAEAEGPVLDWLVAKCEGHQSRCAWMVKDGWRKWQSYEAAWGNPIPAYSTNWAQGGPFIEREIFKLFRNVGGTWTAQIKKRIPHYSPTHDADIGMDIVVSASGKTPLIAAMRCYVASKHGDSAEVPVDLL